MPILTPRATGRYSLRLLDQDDMALYDWMTGEQCASPDEFSERGGRYQNILGIQANKAIPKTMNKPMPP
jgi:hypothetical protein